MKIRKVPYQFFILKIVIRKDRSQLRKNVLIGMTLLILAFATGIVAVSSSWAVVPFYAAAAKSVPVIDGKIGEGEWAGAYTYRFLFNQLNASNLIPRPSKTAAVTGPFSTAGTPSKEWFAGKMTRPTSITPMPGRTTAWNSSSRTTPVSPNSVL
ncbi:MAG: hypothetical protein GX493_09890 [Firmicutes bacterium]|nr:hypothetical protein [Bacillota bacterium]